MQRQQPTAGTAFDESQELMSAALLVGPTQQTQASDHTTAKIQEAETSTGGRQAEDGDKAIEKKEKAGAAAPENDQVAEKVP